MEFSILGIIAVVLELLRPVLLPLGLVILVDLVLLGRVITGLQRFRVASALRGAAIVGAVAAVAAALYLPTWTGASLAQLSSIIDILGVVGGGLGIGIAVGMLSYPPIQLLNRRPA